MIYASKYVSNDHDKTFFSVKTFFTKKNHLTRMHISKKREWMRGLWVSRWKSGKSKLNFTFLGFRQIARLRDHLVTISPTFCEWLFCAKILHGVLSSYFLNFFWCKNIGTNALIKYWWNWPQRKKLTSNHNFSLLWPGLSFVWIVLLRLGNVRSENNK